MVGRIAALSLVLVLGCDYYYGGSGGSRSYGTGSSDVYWEGDDGRTGTAPIYVPEGEELVVTDAFMAGDLGDVYGFAETPFEVSAVRADYGGDVIRFDGTDSRSGQWVMAQVDISGGLDQEVFRPGASVTVSAYGESDVYASGLGCSGPAVGTFTFDQSPDRMQIDVSEGSTPGARRFDIQLEFGTQIVDMSFEVGGSASVPVPATGVLAAATLEGSVDGVVVSGGATFLSELHHETYSTVLIERTEADGQLVRVRFDVEGGLGRLGAGSYGASDGLLVSASTTPYEVDAGYPLEAVDVSAVVTIDGGAPVMMLVATFASGEQLALDLFYR